MIKNHEVGKKVRDNNREFGKKGAAEKKEEAEKRWKYHKSFILDIAKKSPGEYTANSLAKRYIEQTEKKIINTSRISEEYRDEEYRDIGNTTLRARITQDMDFARLLKKKAK